MGYYTSFEGKIDFQMEEKSWHILKWIVDETFSGLVTLERNHLEVNNSWKNRDKYLEDLICFIDKHGDITHLDIHARGEETYDVSRYVLQNGQLEKMGFEFDESTRRAATEEEARNMLEEHVVNFEISFSPEIDEEEKLEIEETLQEKLEENLYRSFAITEAREFLDSLHLNNVRVTLFGESGKISIENRKYEWTDFKENPQNKTKIVPQTMAMFGLNASKEILYSKLDFDTPEEGGRQIQLGETIVPLRTELFPEYPLSSRLDEKCIILPSGEKTTLCSICKHRARKVLNMCRTCKPELL